MDTTLTQAEVSLIDRPYSFRVNLTREERDQLQQEADRQGLSMTDIIRLFIRQLPEDKNKEIAEE